jgi:hypothetical protein
MPEKVPAPAEQANPHLCLNVLTAQRPRGKMAQIRWLWPGIVEAIEAGHTLKEICAHLQQYGLDISYSLFRHYAARLRHRGATKQHAKGTTVAAVRTAASISPAAPARGTDAVPSPFDPLANLRERLANRPGFQFEERPPDDSKLF